MGDLFVYVNQRLRSTTLTWIKSLSVNSCPFVRLSRVPHLHRLGQSIHGQVVVIHLLDFVPREARRVFEGLLKIGLRLIARYYAKPVAVALVFGDAALVCGRVFTAHIFPLTR